MQRVKLNVKKPKTGTGSGNVSRVYGRRRDDGTLRGGRKPGQANRMTRVLKEAIIMAAENVGADGKGKDGLVGYLERIARRDMKAFAPLLGKMLPLQISGDGGTLRIINENTTPSEAAELYAKTLQAMRLPNAAPLKIEGPKVKA